MDFTYLPYMNMNIGRVQNKHLLTVREGVDNGFTSRNILLEVCSKFGRTKETVKLGLLICSVFLLVEVAYKSTWTCPGWVTKKKMLVDREAKRPIQ